MKKPIFNFADIRNTMKHCKSISGKILFEKSKNSSNTKRKINIITNPNKVWNDNSLSSKKIVDLLI